MARKSGLGRGLDALIPGAGLPAEEWGASSGALQVPITQIERNPRQPRSRFDPQELAELATSIQSHGILQPLIVSRGEAPDRYILIAGERRLLAARQAGLTEVPVLVREVSDQQRLEMALIENVQRQDLNPLEAAEAYRQLSEDFQLSHEEIARRVGKSRTAITNTLRLLKLPEKVQEALLEGQITEGHARALLALPTVAAQEAALRAILTHDLTVRQTEELVKKMSGQRPERKPPAPPAPEVRDLERRLQSALGTRVALKPRRKGGTITIHYYSDEELNSLVERLLESEGGVS